MNGPVYTIDNTSPLIHYSPAGAWSEGSQANDPLFDQYSNSTFTLTTAQNASATFQFNGTQIYISGAKRINHGQYSINLDGTVTNADGFSSTDQFKSALFEQDNLDPNTPHTITITNLLSNSAAPYLDLDFISWTPAVKDSPQEMKNDKFTYEPSASWTEHVMGDSGGTSKQTSDDSASCSISFSGQSIALYGEIGPSQALYNAELDGVAVNNDFNGTKDSYSPSTVLFYANNLGEGNHVLKLSRKADPSGGNGKALSIGSAFITPYGIQSKGLSQGALAGIIGSIVGVVLVCCLLIWFLIRRRRAHKRTAYKPFDFGPPPDYSVSDVSHTKELDPPLTPLSYGVSYHNTGSDGGHSMVQVPTIAYHAPVGDVQTFGSDITVGSVLGGRLLVQGRHQDLGPALPPNYTQATEPSVASSNLSPPRPVYVDEKRGATRTPSPRPPKSPLFTANRTSDFLPPDSIPDPPARVPTPPPLSQAPPMPEPGVHSHASFHAPPAAHVPIPF